MSSATKAAVAGVERVLPSRPGVVVLAYHRVGGGTASEVDLDPAVFRAQLEEIRERAATLDDAIAIAVGDAAPAVDPVAVTFDDGTADVVDIALPMLVDAGIHATLYLATSFVDAPDAVAEGASPVSWSGLADAVATGHLAIGSHTHGHVLLDRADPVGAAADLDRSIELVRDRLGVDPVHFAYPKALLASPSVEPLVRSRFRSAAIAGTVPNRYGCTDVHRLRRSPVQVSDGMRWFRAKVSGGMGLEDAARRGLNRFRYAGART